MKNRKPDSARAICEASGLSLSQWKQAKDAGIDVKDLDAMKAFRKTIPTINRPPRETESADHDPDAEPMTLDEMEAELSRPGLSPNDALTAQRRINAMKQLAQYRQATGRLIDRDEVREYFIRAASSIQSFCRKFEKEIPALCLGLPINQSSPKVKDRIREMQTEWTNLEGEFWKDHPEA